MALFGFMLLREFTDDDRAELARLLGAFGVEVVAPPTSPPLPPPVGGNLLDGDVPYGGVTIRWRLGVPLRAWLTTNPARSADVPPRFWETLTANAPQDLWAPFTYLAFLESDYQEGVKNPSTLEESWGVLQVNRRAWPEYPVDVLTTYAGNIRAAVFIYSQQGWPAWLNSARVLGLVA